MPLPKGTRYRFKKTSPDTMVRLAYSGRKAIEVTPYIKKDGHFVKGHMRKYKER